MSKKIKQIRAGRLGYMIAYTAPEPGTPRGSGARSRRPAARPGIC